MTTINEAPTKLEEPFSQINHSVLASLIAISQTLGQLQGEVAVLKASGVDLEPIEREIENLNKIVITGDLTSDSLLIQIRNLKTIVDQIQERVKRAEVILNRINQEKASIKADKEKINLENMWKVIFLIGGAIASGILAWLKLK